MKTILHVALIAPGYSNEGIMNGFFENGFSTYHLFDYQLKTYEFGKDRMRQLLIEEAVRVKPDLIFMQIQNSEVLDLETVKRLSALAFTINYTFDIRISEQTQWLYNMVHEVGLACFSNQHDVDECNRRGFYNAILVQSSCDMTVYSPFLPDIIDRPRHHRALFIGNNRENSEPYFPMAKERREMVDMLTQSFPQEFHSFGMGWKTSRLVMKEEEVDLYRTFLIAICHNNFSATSYTSDRLWRAMATGCFCLTKYFPGIENIFERCIHLDWWETLDELDKRLRYYLDNPKQAERIALAGMAFVRSEHTWGKRVYQMLQHVRRLKPIPETDVCIRVGAHVVEGKIPEPNDEQFHGKTCDCKKLRYEWVECGCANKNFELRACENI